MASKLITDCTIPLQSLFFKFLSETKKAGIFFDITCTARTAIEQTALYSQGRDSLSITNDLRKKAGLYLLPEIDSKTGLIIVYRPVTWTTRSKHLVDIKNPLSRAFDIVLLGKNKKATYDLKVDVNANDILDWIEAANIGKSVGLIAGAFFMKKDIKTGKMVPNPDYPHYEV